MEAGRRGLKDSYGGYRARLLEQLRAKGISDITILRAFGEVPRHLFVPDAVRHRAYEDSALPIGFGQTISQPSTQALYLKALNLKGDEKVLEVGTGSGYQTALLAKVCERVISVERNVALARSASKALEAAGASTATVVVGDGTLGWAPLAPYDAILVSAASPAVPPPLLEQLCDPGVLVIPIATPDGQVLQRITRTGGRISTGTLCGAHFVPLTGRHGYDPAPEHRG